MGLTHGFGPKMGLFPTFFWQYSIGKCPFDILERKNTLRGYKKRSSKSQKIDIFQLFFLGNIGREHVFYDILERKNAFLGLKNKRFKKSKN